MAATKKTTQPKTDVKLIYVIAGKDDFLLGRASGQLLDSLIDHEDRAMGLFDADPDKTPLAEVLDELRTMPFLSSRRVVMIKGADDFVSENRESLEKYFETPSGPGILILTVRSWPSNTKLAKKLPTAGELIEVDAFKTSQLPDFVIAQAASLGKIISRPAAQILVQLVGDDAGRLASEVDKLSTYVNDAKTITPAHIEELIGRNRMFDAFAVLESLVSGDPVSAIDKLRAMFAADRDSEYTIVGAFAWQIRRMFQAKALMAKGERADQVGAKLKIWYQKENFFRMVGRYSLDQFGKMLQELASIDHSIKTGQMSAPVAMEQLIYKLSQSPK